MERVTGTDVDAYMLDIALLAREIADTALGVADAVGGDADLIAAGHDKLATGDDLLAAGETRPAIGRYRAGWGRAAKAASNPTFVTYNASLNRFSAGQLMADLATGDNRSEERL